LFRLWVGAFCAKTVPTVVFALSLHDALPISVGVIAAALGRRLDTVTMHTAGILCVGPLGTPILEAGPLYLELAHADPVAVGMARSEEHTSELQSRENLVCRLLLEKKKETRDA